MSSCLSVSVYPGVDIVVHLPLKFLAGQSASPSNSVVSALFRSDPHGGENPCQAPGPFLLLFDVFYFIVADFDHRAGQPARTRMPFQRVVDAVGRRIGFVDADHHAHCAERVDQRRGQPAIVVVDDADVPWPAHVLVGRIEGMDRYDAASGRPAFSRSATTPSIAS